jgi:hypothetical protein
MRQILSRSAASGGSLVSLVSVALMASAALPVRTASAATIHVMNCNDSGVGSLRGSVASALSGDTIDLTKLPCSRIVLTSGQVVISQIDMTLIGPGRSRLTLDGNHASRIFLHSGGGTLVVKSITIANGYFFLPPNDRYGPPRGGCIKSDSNVELNGIDLHDCLVEEKPYSLFGGSGGGGGVFAQYNLRLINSNVFSNIARYGRGGGANTIGDLVVYGSRIYNNDANIGGGLLANNVSLSYSIVDNNTATAIDEFDVPDAGGILSFSKLVVNKSTVSNNRVLSDPRAFGRGGGASGSAYTYIYDSTFSGNEATVGSAIEGNIVSISNSTIAFNQERLSVLSGNRSQGAVTAVEYSINSSIIARNRWKAVFGNDIGLGLYVHGANNLIERSATPLPADTISVNPLLGPLANNGGPTKTRALLNGSPAIDRGNNFRHRQYDQRGPGFVRVKGTATDIGAFEH